MKLFKTILLSVCLVIGTSCTLDLRENPNAVQPNQVDLNLLLNSMQVSLAGYFQGVSTFGMQMTRLQNSGGTIYNNVYSPESFNGTWSTAYANILEDADQLLKAADAGGLARHAGMTRVISAYILMTLVDYFGDVPFTEAFKGSSNFNPPTDDSETLYMTVILPMLEKAITDLTTPTTVGGGYLNPSAPTPQDVYYSNNYGSWVRAANSLRLKAYLNIRVHKPADATAGINAVIAHPGGLITAANQNFTFRYGSNTADPEARHPRFTANYLSGGGNYMSNWLMWHMYHGYDATSSNATVGQGDPRMRFYFYRQTNANNSDPNNIRCVVQVTPAHYPTSTGTAIIDHPAAGRPPMGVGVNHPTNDPADPAWGRTFCYPTNVGYWGRDHVDPQGIPPDNFLRSAWGVYPAGGRFDANVNGSVSQTQGQRGAGFQPIMMRSYVQFMLAEAALYLGTTGVARTHFQNGITFSMDDVRAWGVNGTYGVGAAATTEASTINTFYPQATFDIDKAAYLASATAAYDDRILVSNDAAMNYIAREYWIASFGNGVEAFNLYRRTGLPSGMQPTVNSAPGDFPRSFWYPANAANLNGSINQKTDLAGKVFWDKNNSNLNF